MPRIATGEPAKSAASWFICGIALTHQPQPRYQKSSTTTLPLRSPSLRRLPSRSAQSKAKAGFWSTASKRLASSRGPASRVGVRLGDRVERRFDDGVREVRPQLGQLCAGGVEFGLRLGGGGPVGHLAGGGVLAYRRQVAVHVGRELGEFISGELARRDELQHRGARADEAGALRVARDAPQQAARGGVEFEFGAVRHQVDRVEHHAPHFDQPVGPRVGEFDFDFGVAVEVGVLAVAQFVLVLGEPGEELLRAAAAADSGVRLDLAEAVDVRDGVGRTRRLKAERRREPERGTPGLLDGAHQHPRPAFRVGGDDPGRDAGGLH